MSHINNELFYESIREKIEDNIEYEAVLKYDGEVVARVTSYSVEGLEEQIRKLEKAEQKLIDKEYDARIDDMAYMDDMREAELSDYYTYKE